MLVARRGCAHSRRHRSRRALALTSGKAPSAKTISSDVFPQPPSPTRTTLTDRAPGDASSSAAWDAFIVGPAKGPARSGVRLGYSEGRARGRPGGAGMWKGRGGGRKCEPGRGRASGLGTQVRGPPPGRRGVAAGRWPFPSHPIQSLKKNFLSTYCVRALRPRQGWIQTQSLSSGGNSGLGAGQERETAGQ